MLGTDECLDRKVGVSPQFCSEDALEVVSLKFYHFGAEPTIESGNLKNLSTEIHALPSHYMDYLQQFWVLRWSS